MNVNCRVEFDGANHEFASVLIYSAWGVVCGAKGY